MTLFRNKYRIASARWQNWDYANAGAYFITICTKNRAHYFGGITDGEMQLSHIGIVAADLWHEIKNHAKDVELGAFQVMPNHIHGILILNHNDVVPTISSVDPVSSLSPSVETGHALSLQSPSPPPPSEPKTIGQQRFQNIGQNSISSIIGSYKSAVTKHANRSGLEFAWQSRFHDRVIRNGDEYARIEDYIAHNPHNWEKDKFYDK